MTTPSTSVLLGENVRRVRLLLGWSQSELARRLGVNQKTVSRIERGEGTSVDMVASLARVLRVTVRDLLTREVA